MCGIAGYIGSKKNLPLKENITKCLNAMGLRRGPDGTNYISVDKEKYSFLFLHSRLSLLDATPRSNQPMEDDQGILSFNGEIYNYLELKTICEKKGIKFKTTSDTEVLLKMLNIFYTKAFEMLDGDWAISYYNKKRDAILLSKDRFSIKPLFFLEREGNIYFASNIVHLFLLLGKKEKMNIERIKNYLSFSFKATNVDPNTFFHNVIKFPSAAYLEFAQGFKRKPVYYWSSKIQIDNSLNYNDSVELVKETLIDSVKLRLRSDFPISCLLSGGIDSSAIAGISKKIFNTSLNCISYKPSNKNYDESELIKLNIDSLNIKHKYVDLDLDDPILELRNLIRDGAIPLNAPSDYLFHRICHEIKQQNYRVLFTGMAGDDFFGGNYIDHLNYLVSVHKKPVFEKAYKDWERNIKPLVRSPHLRDFEGYIKKLNIDKNLTWHEKDLVNNYLNFELPVLNLNYMPNYSSDFFRNELQKCIFDEAVPAHLATNDQIALYHTIEARFPFLSYKLCEVMNSIPSNFIMKNAVTKSILRDALKDIVPAEILNSKNKIGFYCDFNDIFKLNTKEFHDLLFQNSGLNKLLNVDKFREILKKKNTNTAEQKLIFNTLNISLMLEEYDL